MANPYRKLFNLFAFSVLAFAIYLNFFKTEEDPLSPKNNTTNYEQATTVPKSKSIVALENSKTSLAKEEKKN
jgi:hypothetical protein